MIQKSKIIILLFIFISSCNSNEIAPNKTIINNGDSSKYKFVYNDSIKLNCIRANKIYRISDSTALGLLIKYKEINDILNYDYHDSVTYNEINIIGIPNDSNSRWEFDMGQFQKGVDKYYSFIHFWVDANSGKIEVLDLNYGVDDPIDIQKWIELKRKK